VLSIRRGPELNLAVATSDEAVSRPGVALGDDGASVAAFMINTRPIRSFFARRCTSAAPAVAGLALLLGACASSPPAPEPLENDYWVEDRVVNTDTSMITLFDPLDLQHHTADPDNWYQYDFAFLDDMASGRFVALSTAANGPHWVRLTDAPLSREQQALAGPSAKLRLRVLNERLLLSGGSAWPSINRSLPVALASAESEDHWLELPNGDYEVTITALDSVGLDIPDYVLRLERVFTIADVEHAPGIPHVTPTQAVAGVAGVNAAGASFVERCGMTPRKAEYSPLITRSLPLPGALGEIEVAPGLYKRGRALQAAGTSADLPIVVAREASIGTLGVYVKPMKWLAANVNSWGKSTYTTHAHVLCAVRIDSVESGANGLTVGISPEPMSFDTLPRAMAQELKQQFDVWLRLSSNPAYRFTSGYVNRARDHRSLVFGVMQQLDLPATDVETLLLMDNESRARDLIERMRNQLI